MIEMEEGIDLQLKRGVDIHLNESYSLKAQTQILMKDMKGAEISIKNAMKYESAVHGMNFWQSHFLLAQAMLDMYKLEESKKAGEKEEFSRFLSTEC